MAFKVLTLPDNTGKAGQKPFLSEYIETQDGTLDGALYPVTQISLSIKGMMLQTEEFCLFIFKSKEIYKQLLEALDVWIQSVDIKQLMVKIDGEFGDFLLGMDDSVKTTCTKVDKKTYRFGSKKSSKSTTSTPLPNPFLV